MEDTRKAKVDSNDSYENFRCGFLVTMSSLAQDSGENFYCALLINSFFWKNLFEKRLENTSVVSLFIENIFPDDN